MPVQGQYPPATRSTNDLLVRHPLFSDFPPEYLGVLVETASEKAVESGQVIFREGDDALGFFLIVEGSVSLEAFSLQHGPMTVQTLEQGDVFGWSVLVPPHRWRLDARAASNGRLLVLDGPALRERCEQNPGLGYELLRRFAMLLEQRLQAVRQQLIERHVRSW
jgi:CRP-like cAMP-binding protein